MACSASADGRRSASRHQCQPSFVVGATLGLHTWSILLTPPDSRVSFDDRVSRSTTFLLSCSTSDIDLHFQATGALAFRPTSFFTGRLASIGVGATLYPLVMPELTHCVLAIEARYHSYFHLHKFPASSSCDGFAASASIIPVNILTTCQRMLELGSLGASLSMFIAIHRSISL